jgi:transposase
MAIAGPRGVDSCDRKIVERALRAGLTKAQAARQAGVSVPTVRKIATALESQAQNTKRRAP